MSGEKSLPELMVTRGDGVPLPDQKAAVEEFKRQAGVGMSDGLVCGWCGQDPCEDTCAWYLQDQLSAEREANARLREAAEAVLWASNVERIYAAEGEELVAMVKERREAFAALSVALEGKQDG